MRSAYLLLPGTQRSLGWYSNTCWWFVGRQCRMAGVFRPIPLLCTVVLATCVLAEGTTDVQITYNTTGTSNLTPSSLPLPPSSK